MVDLTLTDEQKDLRELAHSFAEKDIRKVAWDYDKDGTWPQDIIEKAWEIGLMNTHVAEEYGGPGLDYLSGCLIEEEMGWGCSGIGTSLMANGLASSPVGLGGSEEVKKKYLGMLTEAPKLASFCLTEPDAGSDVSGMKTTATKKGDKYVINGSKCFITNGGYADWFTVYAKTDKDAGHRGISAFVVPKDDTVTVDKKEDKLGQRASNTATITFNETEIPAENLLGEENHGFKLAMMTLDRTRPGVAAMAVGIARAALEFASDYSKERVQFGVPIAMHQAVAFMIADMATKVEAARLLVWQSAVLLDQGHRNTLAASHAKRFAADSAMEVTTDAVQVYGGYGFIKEYPVEKLMRDAKIMQLYEGTSQIQRLVIAKELLMGRQADEETPEAKAAKAKQNGTAEVAAAEQGARHGLDRRHKPHASRAPRETGALVVSGRGESADAGRGTAQRPARALAAQQRAEDHRQPDRAVRREELRDHLCPPARCAGAAATHGRRHPRLRGDCDAPRPRADRRPATGLAAAALVSPGARCGHTEALLRGPAEADPLARAPLAPPGRRSALQPLSHVVYGAGCWRSRLTAFLAPPFTGLDTLPALGVVLISLGVLLDDALLASGWLDRRRAGCGPGAGSGQPRGQGSASPVLEAWHVLASGQGVSSARHPFRKGYR